MPDWLDSPTLASFDHQNPRSPPNFLPSFFCFLLFHSGLPGYHHPLLAFADDQNSSKPISWPYIPASSIISDFLVSVSFLVISYPTLPPHQPRPRRRPPTPSTTKHPSTNVIDSSRQSQKERTFERSNDSPIRVTAAAG